MRYMPPHWHHCSTPRGDAEGSLRAYPLLSFIDFDGVKFDNYSTILNYRAGSMLEQTNLYTYTHGKPQTPEAQTGSINGNGTWTGFTVARV